MPYLPTPSPEPLKAVTATMSARVGGIRAKMRQSHAQTLGFSQGVGGFDTRLGAPGIWRPGLAHKLWAPMCVHQNPVGTHVYSPETDSESHY